MISPTISFIIVVAIFCGALMHLFAGGTSNQLLLYIGAAFIGSLIGQGVGQVLGIVVVVVGRINVVGASVGIITGLVTARVLSVQQKRQSRDNSQ